VKSSRGAGNSTGGAGAFCRGDAGGSSSGVVTLRPAAAFLVLKLRRFRFELATFSLFLGAIKAGWRASARR